MKKLILLSLAVSAMVIVSLMSTSILHGLNNRRWSHTVGHVAAVEKRYHGSVASNEIFLPEIIYVYDVGGKEFTSKALSAEPYFVTRLFSYFGLSYNPSIYTIGQPILVYYNPDRPFEAVMRPGVSLAAWIALSVALSALLMSVLNLRSLANARQT